MSQKIYDFFIFEKGSDPGVGSLRVVGDTEKLKKIELDRSVTLKEIYEVLFGNGRSKFLKEFYHKGELDGMAPKRRFKIVGLTEEGKPLIVIFAPLEDGGLKKKVVTAWRCSRTGDEVKKLLEALPELESELIKD